MSLKVFGQAGKWNRKLILLISGREMGWLMSFLNCICCTFLLQLFREGANATKEGRAGICTEPPPAAGLDR